MKKKIIIFTFTFLTLFICNYFFRVLSGDEIWGYGFSYNIAQGMIPYKDFNMIVLPFYSLIMSIPLLICNNLVVFHIINALIVSLIITYVSKDFYKAILLLLLIIIIPYVYSYNTFILMLFILFLYLEKNNINNKDIISPLILSIILCTKQNVGILLVILYFIFSKNKKKTLLYISIPIGFTLLYLIVTNSFRECIDYTFLGMGSFLDNFYCNIVIFVMYVLLIIFLIYKYVKGKDNNILYLICFQIIVFPLFEMYHFIIGIIPVIYYFVENKRLMLIFYVICILFFMALVDTLGVNLSSINTFKYRNMNKNVENNIEVISREVYNNKDKRVFIFSTYSYLVKINLGLKLDKFDLVNRGNIGSDREKYIDEIRGICKKNKCMFIMDKNTNKTQVDPYIIKFVLRNYKCSVIENTSSYMCED